MAHHNYTITYRPVTELIEEVRHDMSNYDAFGMIDSFQIVRTIILKLYELGFRIYHIKEDILDIKDGRAELPEYFVKYNFGFLCLKKTGVFTSGHGIKIVEEPTQDTPDITYYDQNGNPAYGYKSIEPNVVDFGNLSCSNNHNNVVGNPALGVRYLGNSKRILFNRCDGSRYELIREVDASITTFNVIRPVVLHDRYSDSNPFGLKCRDCGINIKHMGFGEWFNNYVTASIRNGFMYFEDDGLVATIRVSSNEVMMSDVSNIHVDDMKVYINYTSLPYDEEQKVLLIPDNPIINQFLEYAVKVKIMENALFNSKDPTIGQKFQLIEQRYREYMMKAHALVNMPNFKEMAEAWRMNRKALERKYFSAFSNL